MPVLIPEPGYLLVLQVQTIEGNVCAMVNCRDYDHYSFLPEVVSHHGRLLGKTGWNSDTQRAHYQSNAPMVRIERW